MCTVFIMMQKPLALADLEGAWGAHLPPPPLKLSKMRVLGDMMTNVHISWSILKSQLFYLPLISNFTSIIQSLLDISYL